MKITQLISCALLAANILIFNGCTTSQPDPLAGWKPLFGHENETFDKSVKEDYQSYTEKLPNNEKGFIGPIQLFKDETGQHAVRIEIARNGTDWAHILIYDKNNRRIKIIKFVSGHYRS